MPWRPSTGWFLKNNNENGVNVMWIARVKTGTFEKPTLTELANDIANYYVSAGVAPTIESLMWSDGKFEMEVEPAGITDFGIACDEIIEDLIEYEKSEQDHIRSESALIRSQWL